MPQPRLLKLIIMGVKKLIWKKVRERLESYLKRRIRARQNPKKNKNKRRVNYRNQMLRMEDRQKPTIGSRL